MGKSYCRNIELHLRKNRGFSLGAALNRSATLTLDVGSDSTMRDSANFRFVRPLGEPAGSRPRPPISSRDSRSPVVQEAIEKADVLIEAMGWIRRSATRSP